jgi:hypothetical protein
MHSMAFLLTILIENSKNSLIELISSQFKNQVFFVEITPLFINLQTKPEVKCSISFAIKQVVVKPIFCQD